VKAMSRGIGTSIGGNGGSSGEARDRLWPAPGDAGCLAAFLADMWPGREVRRLS
jgi:hypothetical protein